MRSLIALDRSWRLREGEVPAWRAPDFSPESWDEVSIPRANLELPFNGFDETSYQFVSTWLRDVELPADIAGKRVFLDFEGVMAKAVVYLNGIEAGRHSGGFTPFSIEVGAHVSPGRNRLAVVVDSSEDPGVPPFGHVVDYLCYGGIYREVFLRIQGQALVSGVFARPADMDTDRKSLHVDVSIDRGAETRSLEIVATISDRASGRVLATVRAPAGGAETGLRLDELRGIGLWDLRSPVLYDLGIALLADGNTVDERAVRVGFRSAEWRPDGFFLNGRRLKIRGLNRHQSWPYVGYAMPARAQRRDAEILRRELGVNLVRSSHYPPSRHFLDACDELGLLVFEELPGWQHIGGAAWKDHALRDLRDMIVRDRNHPSIVLWGVRINESRDDHDFYARTNALARELDPARATGGVRYLRKSEFLEDVYTFNDFVHAGGRAALKKPRAVTGLRRDVPYLVTEHNGHMFPTKRFDQEERLAEQARRHARVLDAACGDPGISGAIGWCAFDYNTHKDFGSGDRVCYHGVSDMARVPKWAAAVYASQVEPSERVVMEAASLFAKGERSGAFLLPIEVWTNCDEIILWRGGERVGSFFPDRTTYPGLPHPPVVIRDLVGDRLGAEGFSARDQKVVREVAGVVSSRGAGAIGPALMLRMWLMMRRRRMTYAEGEALIQRFALGWGQKDESFELVGHLKGQEAIRRRYGADARAATLDMRVDDSAIAADGVDVTRVVLRLLDQYGNIHPYAQEALELRIEGPGEIIGPRLVPLVGGVAAFWVRSTGAVCAPGMIVVSARGSRFEAGPVMIGTEPMEAQCAVSR